MKSTKKISTKDLILEKAVKLFNQQGVQNITNRHIAQELGKSYGNIDYHFKNKEEILLGIYKLMRDEMSISYLARKEYSTSLEYFHRLLIQLETIQSKYRFFNLDVLDITRSFSKISNNITKTLELRKQQMEVLFQEFQDEGYLNPIDVSESLRLQHTIRIMVTFWLSQQEVLLNYKFQESGEMTRHIWGILIPNLTEDGLKKHKRLIGRFGYN